MKTTSTRERLLASTMIGGVIALAMAAAPAYAQQEVPSAQGQDVAAPQDARPAQGQPTQADDPTEPTTVGEVVVTGSRLPQRDLVANSPIETVSQEEMQNAGTLTVETFLNTLPQISPSVSTAANNPSANGAALIDLRGLGTERNLVLLDGRRIVGSDSTNAVDVNIIPTALIERVEIITGGASAVYGADAVAGVVNFILRNDFEGVELDAQLQTSGMQDANQQQFSVTIGGNFDNDRGNAVFNLTYANREEVSKGARDFTAQATNATSFFPSGSYNVAATNRPTPAAINAVFAQYGATGVSPTTNFGFNGDGTLFSVTGTLNFRRDPSEIATAFAPNFSFNFEPQNKLILPLERQTFSTFVNYDITDRINIYAQGVMANYNAATALASSPAPTASNPLYPGQGLVFFTIPVTNPFIPADLATLLASRTGDNPVLNGTGAGEEFSYRFRANALGPRLSSNEISVYHALIGTKVQVTDDWEGDIYYSQGRYILEEIQNGNVNVRRFENLLDSPTGGTEFCEGGFNPFGVGLNASCAAYVNVIAKNRTTIEQDNAVAVFNGPIIDLFAGTVYGAFGAEYRSIDYNFIPDVALQPGEVSGFNGANPLQGSIDFYDLFTEVSIPLLADRPWVRALDLTLGGRFTDASVGDNAFTYKAELSYSPIEALRFRASYQHAIRSPGVGELFTSPTENNPEVDDPCNADADRTAAALAICRQQAINLGFTPAQADTFLATYQQGNDQIQSLIGGNPNLDAEEADTLTLGVVFRPTWDNPYFQNISTSVDYFNIEITDAIDAPDAQLLVNNCYNSGSASSAFCLAFQRGSGDFGILDLLQLQANQGLISTEGVDFSLGFTTPLDDLTGNPWFGRLRVGFILTYLMEYLEQEAPGAETFDFAGSIGQNYGETLPEYKANLNFGWESGPFGVDLRARYISEMTTRNDIIAGGDDPDAFGPDSAWYWDLATRWAINDTVEVRFGVLNLFDREIERYEPFIDAQTDPSTYDVIGRRFFTGINLRF